MHDKCDGFEHLFEALFSPHFLQNHTRHFSCLQTDVTLRIQESTETAGLLQEI